VPHAKHHANAADCTIPIFKIQSILTLSSVHSHCALAGWYVSPPPKHYNCHKVYFPDIMGERDALEVDLLPQNYCS